MFSVVAKLWPLSRTIETVSDRLTRDSPSSPSKPACRMRLSASAPSPDAGSQHCDHHCVGYFLHSRGKAVTEASRGQLTQTHTQRQVGYAAPQPATFLSELRRRRAHL